MTGRLGRVFGTDRFRMRSTDPRPISLLRALLARAHPKLCLLVAAAAPSAAVRPPRLDYQLATLPNGLTVVMEEDHSTPIVHAQLWYHVGSRNEKPGRTGFAHLFEHLMFKGSKNVSAEAHTSM